MTGRLRKKEGDVDSDKKLHGGHRGRLKARLHDPVALLYYKLYVKTPVTRKYLMVAVKVDNGEGFILTSFFTDKTKAGETIWKK